MKDTVEVGRLTTFGSFRTLKHRFMDFKTSFKFHTSVSNFEAASPKPYKLLKILFSFLTTVKSRHPRTIWK